MRTVIVSQVMLSKRITGLLPTEDLQNVTDYCETMKQAYWPDWDECITRGGTCKATK